MSSKFAIAFLFCATAVFAQVSIVNVSPAEGSTFGGDVLILHFLNPPFCDPAACQYSVTFGDVAVAPTDAIAFDMLRVVTPPHASGDVEVTLIVNGNVAAKYPIPFRFTAPDISNYETVLIPLAIGSDTPVPGAFGSRWTTELWVSNTGNNDVELFNGFPSVREVIAAHASRTIALSPDATSAGYLFYVQKGGAENVHFSLRVRDVSRSTENSGTELPVFRHSGFETIPSATILNVPIDDTSRTSLRIYGDGIQPAHLRIVRLPDGAVIVDDSVPVAPADLLPFQENHGFPARSMYAQIGDLRAAYSQLAAGRYRIEVGTTGSWIWALATTTNNTTQLVTAMSAQAVQPYGEIRQ